MWPSSVLFGNLRPTRLLLMRYTINTMPLITPLLLSLRCFFILLLSRRLVLLAGVREGRSSYQVAGIRVAKSRDEAFANTGVHGAVRSTRLVSKTGEVGLEELFLKMLARIRGHDLIAQV